MNYGCNCKMKIWGHIEGDCYIIEVRVKANTFISEMKTVRRLSVDGKWKAGKKVSPTRLAQQNLIVFENRSYLRNL